MMTSCKEIAEQLSENLDQPITGMRRFQLKLHLLICKVCRMYGDQIKLAAKTINFVESKVKPSEALTSSVIDEYKKIHHHGDS